MVVDFDEVVRGARAHTQDLAKAPPLRAKSPRKRPLSDEDTNEDPHTQNIQKGGAP